ncbi:MAG: hypothetical protein FWC89_01055 [Defluviitaleaceae bacterium]|nr:hypothetical protein [Defluviitaleaceae bacterium]
MNKPEFFLTCLYLGVIFLISLAHFGIGVSIMATVFGIYLAYLAIKENYKEDTSWSVRSLVIVWVLSAVSFSAVFFTRQWVFVAVCAFIFSLLTPIVLACSVKEIVRWKKEAKGKKEWEENHREEMAKIEPLKKQANNGNAESQYKLGLYYLDKYYLNKYYLDNKGRSYEDEGMEWLKKAALQGHEIAKAKAEARIAVKNAEAEAREAKVAAKNAEAEAQTAVKNATLGGLKTQDLCPSCLSFEAYNNTTIFEFLNKSFPSELERLMSHTMLQARLEQLGHKCPLCMPLLKRHAELIYNEMATWT